jgi:hypothetical protein
VETLKGANADKEKTDGEKASSEMHLKKTQDDLCLASE